MGFITKYSTEFNFHYTKGLGNLLVNDFINEVQNIINNPNFIKNMNAIWDLRYYKFPEHENKINLLVKFINGTKEFVTQKGNNYKLAIIIDDINTYSDLSNYIILAKEHNLPFEINIFKDLYETFTWFEINKKHHKEILNFLIND